MKVKVLSTLVDKKDFSKTYNQGDIIDNFDEARITDLVSRGLVEAYEDKEEKGDSTEEKNKKVSK